MSAAVLASVTTARSSRLLADVKALDARYGEKAPALSRLEAVLGRDLANRLVAALSSGPRR